MYFVIVITHSHAIEIFFVKYFQWFSEIRLLKEISNCYEVCFRKEIKFETVWFVKLDVCFLRGLFLLNNLLQINFYTNAIFAS